MCRLAAYRTNKKHPAEVRAAVTPKKKADRPRGQWNSFIITMKGDRLWVKLNGEEVIRNAELPGVPKEGPLALQHHGSWNKAAGKCHQKELPRRNLVAECEAGQEECEQRVDGLRHENELSLGPAVGQASAPASKNGSRQDLCGIHQRGPQRLSR